MIALYASGERRVAVVEEARRWAEAGLVAQAQAAAVRERYRPELVRVNLFIRILLALFTAVVVVALVALPAVVLRVEEFGVALLLLLCAPLCAWIADRQLIHARRLYRCGAEEALLILAVCLISLAVLLLGYEGGRSGEQLGGFAAHGILLAGAAMLAVRYGYALAALGAMIAMAAVPVHLNATLGWHQPDLAWAMRMLLLGTVATWAQWRLSHRDRWPRGYVWCLETVRLAAWAGVYLDVNLFLHRTLLWRSWLGWTPGTRALSWSDPVCAVLTALLPVAALALGIGRRDRALLWFGVISGVASVLTCKYYLHLGYLAEELTAAGLALAGLACGLLRWLRTGSGRRRGCFTAEPLLEPRLYNLDAEALAAIQPLSPTAKTPQTEEFSPGGGGFGGGGASGSY